jgi:fructosamine-3-kinase
LGYECFEFIEGEHFDGSLIDPKEAVNQIATIVESYPEYPHDKYGFLNDEKASWREFLLDEIDYAYRTITDVSQEKVLAAVEKIGYVHPKQYLMHGDFGTHNFLLSNGKIRVIDPMPVVGDRLYDFYFAILSDTDIFAELGMDYYMNFFGEYEPEYKKALLIVALYVRMSRAAVYDKDNLDKYKKLYAEI